MRKGVWYGLLTGLALLLAACGGGGQPDLTLAGISPQNPAVVQGQTVTLTLTFTSQNGFQGQVSLSVLEGGQPVSWLSPNAVQRNLNVPRGQQVQETLEVQVAANAPTGPHALKLRASYGDKVAERDLTLTVNAPPSFTLSDPTPNPFSVKAGGTATFQVTLTSQNGFQGQVTLSLADGQNPLPQGLSITATNPSPINLQAGESVTVTATVSADAQVAPGIYRLEVRAASGSLIREANLTVGVWTDYTNAYVYQVSGDGGVLVGSVSMLGAIRPMTWQINAASLSQGFYWLSAVAQQTFVLDTGVPSTPYGVVLGVTADGQVGCGYGATLASASAAVRALAWNLTTLQPIPLPDAPDGGNVAYACAKRGSDVYIVGRIIPNFPTPTIWRNYTIWHQNISVGYGIQT